MPTPGDISQALSSNPSAYSLSLGHMEDLTLDSFAYFRLPLVIAGMAFLGGCAWDIRGSREAGVFGGGFDDDYLFSCGAIGVGGF